MALLMATRRATFSSARVLSRRLHPPVSVPTFSSRYLHNHTDGATGHESDRKVCPTTVGSGDITRSNEFSMNRGNCDAYIKNPLQIWGPKGTYEVKKVEQGVFLRMEMPGIDKEDVKISFDGDTIYVKGQCKKEIHEETGKEYSFRIKIPCHEFNTNHQEVESEMRSGVLRMLIPDVSEDVQIEGIEGIDHDKRGTKTPKTYADQVREVKQMSFAKIKDLRDKVKDVREGLEMEKAKSSVTHGCGTNGSHCCRFPCFTCYMNYEAMRSVCEILAAGITEALEWIMSLFGNE